MAELPPEAVQHTGPPHSTLLTECGDSDSHGDIHTVSPFSWGRKDSPKLVVDWQVARMHLLRLELWLMVDAPPTHLVMSALNFSSPSFLNLT